MDQVLSIFNSKWKKKLIPAIIFILIFYVVDFSIYQIFFSQYDKFYKLSDALKKQDVLIIGSSHILWDIDSVLMEKKLNKKIGVLNIPGANMEMRYVFLNDYLERFPESIPDLVILEADKYVLHPHRYPPNTYKSILGYYHKGLYRSYFRKHVYSGEGIFSYIVFLAVKSYSYNQYFHYFGGRIFDKYFLDELALSFFASSLYAQEVKNLSAEENKKVAEWKKLYDQYDHAVDPTAKKYLQEFVNLVNEHNIKLVMLDTPNYNLGNDRVFDNIRNIIKGHQSERIRYLRLSPEKFENDLKYLHDASHLNLLGKYEYTNELLDQL
ncbi:MAG: hypothetical protein OEZ34_08755 [Spirochaetia bacterium]|nr:hypothetical protein [Spirochaetia bacterium]